MSEIVREFERQLAHWKTRYADDPDRELLRLYLVALEREENVAVAYDPHVLGPRLAKMHVPTDLRDLMRATLEQIWHDEERHTVYVKQMLANLGRPTVRARMLVQQLAGVIGGWSVAVRQHRGRSETPIAHAAATLLVWAGNVSGRVPQAVRRHLGFCSFRDFCRYNVQTEGTAWLCWDRLATLALSAPQIPEVDRRQFRCIAEDEDRHRQMFGVLANVLTAQDELRDGVSAASLIGQIQCPRTSHHFSNLRGDAGKPT